MFLTKAQKIVIVITACLLFILLLFPPQGYTPRVDGTNIRYQQHAWIATHKVGYRIDFSRLFLEGIAVCFPAGLFLFLSRRP